MKLRLENGLSISALTGAKLGRFSIVAESAQYIYAAIYKEGYAMQTVAAPQVDNEQVHTRLGKLEKIAARYQPLLDDIMRAEDYPAFKEGKPAPIANAQYWVVRKALESEELN